MRILSWIAGLTVAAMVVTFALSNRDRVLIGLWPFTDGIDMPIYLALTLFFLLGTAFGWLLAGWLGWRRRRALKKAAP